MSKRILIVGGVAGGASVAARARRIDAQAEIIMFERGPHVSFSNCSLPYHLSGTVENSEALIMMSPEKFKKSYDIDARVNREVTAIHREKKTIEVKNTLTGEVTEEAYDILVLASGAEPIRPRSIRGTDSPNVYTVRNVVDILRLKEALNREEVREVAVIGGGFIGIEVAENLCKSGKQVTVIEAMDQILSPLDYDMVQMVQKEMMDHGVQVIVGDGVIEIDCRQVVLSSGRTIAAQVVVLAIGVAPETSLARQAGLEIGETGGIKVDHCYRTSDKDIYAVGDAIEVTHQLTQKPSRLALAGPALRQARAAADSMYGITYASKGVIGSCAIRVFDLNVAATGLNEKTAKREGIPCNFAYVIPGDKVGIMPGSAPMHFKLIFQTTTGKILGAQAVGKGNVDKRVDVIAALIAMNGTVEDLKNVELCYSPVFGTARDVVNQAGMVASNLLNGCYRQISVTEVRKLVEDNAFIVDVREENEFAEGHLKGAVNIPLSQLRERMEEIPKDRPVYVHCRSGQRSYNAVMALQGHGYTNVCNVSGSFLGICLYEYYRDVTEGRERIVTEYNFK